MVAILGVLVGLLLPALARAKGKAHAVACASNQRQLGLAFLLYCDGNEDGFPTGAVASTVSAQPEDWIWWQMQRGPSPTTRYRDVPYPGGQACRQALSQHDLTR